MKYATYEERFNVSCEGRLSVISMPSYAQEFEPVPKIQAIPGLLPHVALAEAKIS